MLLSIITVNYNNLSGLIKTYESIAAQTYRDFQWIVIDGGSSDGSRDFLHAHESEISYWVSEPDRGIYHAMNKGIEQACGEYFNFLNSGDAYFDKDVITDFAHIPHDVDVIYGYDKVVDANGNVTWTWTAPEIPIRLEYFLQGKSVRHQSTFISCRCFEDLRYNEHHKINSDHELFMTLFYRGYSFRFFDRCVVLFDGEGISSKYEYLSLYNREVQDSIKRLLPEGMRNEYAKMRRYTQIDVSRMAMQIVDSNKVLRHLARLWLKPLCFIADMCKKTKQR